MGDAGPYVYRLGGNSCLSGDYMGLWSFDHELQIGEMCIRDSVRVSFLLPLGAKITHTCLLYTSDVRARIAHLRSTHCRLIGHLQTIRHSYCHSQR